MTAPTEPQLRHGPEPEGVALPAGTGAGATARQLVADALPAGAAPAARDRAELVMSELVTNAVEHGSGTHVGVSVQRRGTTLVMRVTNDSARPLPPRPWTMPPPDDLRGRGLAIVRSVARHVEAHHGDGVVEVRAVVDT